MRRLLHFLILPPEISPFERSYLLRINRIALAFFAIHLPVFILIGAFDGGRPWEALMLTVAALVGPITAHFTLSNPRTESVVHGITAMLMGAILVHLGQGPAQIEMHFYFFALLAMCAVFGNPLVIVAAAATVVIHHLTLWLLVPNSVFNYDAAYWVVGIHALFVLLETVATVFIARSFFDNVIGLERIVKARTSALDRANEEMRLLLDNVQQGFLVVDASGKLSPQRSLAVDRWFGAPAEGQSWLDYLKLHAPSFERNTRTAWAEVVEGTMPIEVTVAQMPSLLSLGGSHYEVAYQPIGPGERPERFLIILTNITDSVQRERAETELREAMALFSRVMTDRGAVTGFFEEASAGVRLLLSNRQDLVQTRRTLHTLKGNAGLFGLRSLERLCQDAEDRLAEPNGRDEAVFAAVTERWQQIAGDLGGFLQSQPSQPPDTQEQQARLEADIRAGVSHEALVRRLEAMKLEPTSRRLNLFAEQAKGLARRLGKDVEVRVEDNGVRLEPAAWSPFWTHFVHCVRNAVDHGLERPEERAAGGKSSRGLLSLRTVMHGGQLTVEVEDDGRGVDWGRVKELALKAGLPSETDEELRQALFADGLSTADRVTDLSGRGVGLAAVLQSTVARGGAIEIKSRKGRGTLIRICFPAPDAYLASAA